MSKENNIAYIDGQNLYMGTTKMEDGAWRIDLKDHKIKRAPWAPTPFGSLLS